MSKNDANFDGGVVRGDGYNGKYTAQQFIDAIPGTGGVISSIAERVGCSWHTAKKYIELYATAKRAWEDERHRITDIARNNIISAIEDKKDLQMSKWWIQVMDEEFKPTSRQELTGPEGTPLKMEGIVRVIVHGNEDKD